MKIKFWNFEYEFDTEDAKIVVPLVLVILSLIFTQFNKEILLTLTSLYYILYFFSQSFLLKIKALWNNWYRFRCPSCKSKKVFLQGYQGYKSDEQYPYYLCADCHQTSVLIGSGLIIPDATKPVHKKNTQKNY